MADRFRTRSKPDFLVSCLLVCCGLLTVASFTFAMYTVREFSLLKARVSELESAVANVRLTFPKSDIGSPDSLKSSVKSEKFVDKVSKSIQKRTSETVSRGRRRKLRNAISIHLITRTKRRITEGGQFLTDWTIRHSFGNVTYHAPLGCVVIDVPGIYLVYSQLLFQGDRVYASHETFINGKMALKRPIALHHKRKITSSYQSAAFPLQRHDRVCIREGLPSVVVNPIGSYFGVALLSHT